MSDACTPKDVSCLVLGCENTSITHPKKIFLSVPHDPQRRMLWLKAMRREMLEAIEGPTFCCEDHFDMENDIENYMYIKTMKQGKFKLKPNVVPHRFDWQSKDSTSSNGGSKRSKQGSTSQSKRKMMKIEPTATITKSAHEIGTQVCAFDLMESKSVQTEFLEITEEENVEGALTPKDFKLFIQFMHKRKIEEKMSVKLELV